MLPARLTTARSARPPPCRARLTNAGDPWVTASDIGTAAYCPYQLYLRCGGAPVDARTAANLASGRLSHQRWNARELTRWDALSRRRRWIPTLRGVLRTALVLTLFAAALVGLGSGP